jgi:transcriptional regulator with XRE-family HTH domain
MQRFGEKLRALRKKNNLTLKQLAEKLDFDSHSYLSAIEFGKKQPSIELVIKIAVLFKVKTDDLLFDQKEI